MQDDSELNGHVSLPGVRDRSHCLYRKLTQKASLCSRRCLRAWSLKAKKNVAASLLLTVDVAKSYSWMSNAGCEGGEGLESSSDSKYGGC